MSDYFEMSAQILRNQFAADVRIGKIRAKRYVTLSFDCFEVEVQYHMEGFAHPATQESPVERPAPHVDECTVSCGDWRQIVPFELLSHDVQEQVEEVIAGEEE